MTDLLADARSELREVEAEANMLGQALAALAKEPRHLEGIHGWLAIQGMASAIEKIYSGCERVMLRVADRVDRHMIAKGEQWHRALVLRMAKPYRDIRPALLSEATYRRLDALRSFRHRERNTYGRMLDTESVLGIAYEAIEIPALLRTDLEALASALPTEER